ncbi:hypothetical protein EZ449_04300 [Pedobacter frigidisoli]|uniref:RNA polymerase sigma-70 region 4 domain-containing protein n=1 Tax=Pedobacter frigidisoli TaxID=2530455 RepID=A0A4V2MN60_9SPHI|nr:sigma factor-like helix-turn-helix DNA-binding protein [Pedobacter frigidisoli]TCD11490.1 hypothetical protein EZ449_04300 [Pedobacter frigidisoli]
MFTKPEFKQDPMSPSMHPSSAEHKENFIQFQKGNEKGLEFFYKLLYPSLYYSGLRYIKDDVNADCIVNEAFLRLWLARKKITDASQVRTFVSKLTSDGCKAYFKTSSNRFNRNMLRLDEIENYQDFMVGCDGTYEVDNEILCDPKEEMNIRRQWEEVEVTLSTLTTVQQLFIRLCIKYSFDYGRIAWHIGGISDYQVAVKVERALNRLKSIITETKKLNVTGKTDRFKFEGDISKEQQAILRMRYELQYSFEEIAHELNLNQRHIQQAFVNASLKIKKTKIM